MEEKKIKINVPDGYEIDKENSTFEYIKFKPIVKNLPKTWKEYCKTHPRREGEAWITQRSEIDTINNTIGYSRDPEEDRNLLPNQQYAKAMIALCQLIQLRDCYNGDWMPDWTNTNSKYVIYVMGNRLIKEVNVTVNRILAFKSTDLRDQFYVNFRDLIEIAKPLL